MTPKPTGTRFLTDLTTVATGTGMAQVVTLAATPIISRLFTPDHFGSAAFFLAVAGVLLPIASLRYEQAIVLPKENPEAAGIARLSGLVLIASTSVVLSAVLLVTMFGLTDQVFRSIGYWSLLLPLALLVAGANAILASWRTRGQHFRSVAIGVVGGATAIAGSRIGAGLTLGSSVGALILGTMVGYATTFAILWRGSGLATAFRQGSLHPPTRELGTAYSDFPRHAAPTALLNRLSQTLPLLALIYFFPPAVVGLYALADRALRAPLQAVTDPVRRVFYQRSAAVHNRGGSLRTIFTKLTLGLLALGTIPSLVLIFFGAPLFHFVFGPTWTESGRFAAVMNVVFIVRRKQGLWLILNAAQTFARIVAITISIWWEFSPLDTMLAFSAVSAISNIGIILCGFVLVRIGEPVSP
jgi:O-antigen/teichoic acid export membrane protein